MEGVIWLFLVLLVALIAFGVVAGLRRKRLGVDPPRHCSSCKTPMSLRRVSLLQRLTFRGMWMCPHCGTRMRKKAGMAGTATR
jgi:ribosomal protein L37AE/L43A